MKKCLHGAPLIPVRERKYRDKPCKTCGEYFSPSLPYQKYCCDECRQRGYATIKKQNEDMLYRRKRTKRIEEMKKHHLCPVCGKPLSSMCERVHFDCMIERVKQGDHSQQTRKYFFNRGYTAAEVDEIAQERTENYE